MSESRPNREEIVRRLQQPGAHSVKTMAEETGIPKATLYYWLSRNTPAGGHDSTSQQGSPGMNKRRESRAPSTKLRLVAESIALQGDALGTWCKQHGVTVDELLSWRDLALSGIEESTGAQSGVSRSGLETHLGKLEKEIRR